MDSPTLQAILSVMRHALSALGGWLVFNGYLTDDEATQIIGALIVAIPVIYGAWDKFRADRAAKELAALALNVGIVVSDNVVGKTPPVPAAKVPDLLAIIGPSVLMPLNPEIQPVVGQVSESVVSSVVSPNKPAKREVDL